MRTDRGGADVAIGWNHHLVHNGKLWTLSDEATGVMIISPRNYLIKVGTGRPLHVSLGVVATAGFKVELFEGTTVSGDGTTLASKLVNNNRVEPEASVNLTAFHTPTITGDGTLLASGRAGGNSHPQSPGGSARTEEEWILKPSTNYLIRITVVADSTTVTFDASVYEG